MDNKIAIGWLCEIKDKYIHGGDEEFDYKRKEALDYAIKIIEQMELPKDPLDSLDPSTCDLDLLCNSLNAEAGRLRQTDIHLSRLLLKSQGVINYLRKYKDPAAENIDKIVKHLKIALDGIEI